MDTHGHHSCHLGGLWASDPARTLLYWFCKGYHFQLTFVSYYLTFDQNNWPNTCSLTPNPLLLIMQISWHTLQIVYKPCRNLVSSLKKVPHFTGCWRAPKKFILKGRDLGPCIPEIFSSLSFRSEWTKLFISFEAANICHYFAASRRKKYLCSKNSENNDK